MEAKEPSQVTSLQVTDHLSPRASPHPKAPCFLASQDLSQTSKLHPGGLEVDKAESRKGSNTQKGLHPGPYPDLQIPGEGP